MALQIFRYTIHRVGVKKAMARGEIRKRRLEQAVKSLQQEQSNILKEIGKQLDDLRKN